MYTSKKDKIPQHKSAAQEVVQQKAKGFQLKDNRPSTTVSTITQLASNDVIQKRDKYYWVVKPGSKIYVGTFKNHQTASNWWRANKSSYRGYTFGEGSSATKYR